ncbi:MAG: deoxyribonuclease IV [Spirochaetales bacterium]
MAAYRIGVHVPVLGGVRNVPLIAEELGAKAFAFFTKNQKQWKGKPLTKEDIQQFQYHLEKVGIAAEYVLPHNGYLINIGNPDKEKRIRSIDALIEEADRAYQLGLHLLNFHPGSHLGQLSENQCLHLVAEGMRQVLQAVPGVILVLETTAGQGNSVGYTFEHLAELIELSSSPERVGVCVDTCHIFAAGYELRTEKGFEKTFESFSKIIGFEKLKGLHINDSRVDLGSRVDRHASLGKGYLGIPTFARFLRDARFEDLPLILETPNPRLWRQEINLLKQVAEGVALEELPPLGGAEQLPENYRLLPRTKSSHLRGN